MVPHFLPQVLPKCPRYPARWLPDPGSLAGSQPIISCLFEFGTGASSEFIPSQSKPVSQ